MSIFDMFKTVPTAQPAAPAVATPVQQAAPTPGNIPASAAAASTTVATAGTAPNGAVPVNEVTADGATKSGLDQFADIWNTQAQQGTQGQPLFNVSQEKMMEAARKQNFGFQPSPEQAAKITAGGPEAVQAMMEMMNTMAQNVYAHSAFASTRLIEGALEKSQFARAADIDNKFKSLTVTNTLNSENPIFSNPAAQPLLDSVKNQLLVKYPNATPNELATMAKTFLQDFITAANAPQAQQQQQAQAQAAAGEDWSKFFSPN